MRLPTQTFAPPKIFNDDSAPETCKMLWGNCFTNVDGEVLAVDRCRSYQDL